MESWLRSRKLIYCDGELLLTGFMTPLITLYITLILLLSWLLEGLYTRSQIFFKGENDLVKCVCTSGHGERDVCVNVNDKTHHLAAIFQIGHNGDQGCTCQSSNTIVVTADIEL
jgi:hypothetical protein